MPSKLIFGSKSLDQTVLCDYCRYHKCDWIEATPQKLPDFCPRPKSFELADEYIPKEEFTARVEIAKMIGTYQPGEKKWQFSIKAAKGLSGSELQGIIEEVNGWSQKNNFELTDMITYEKSKWF